MSWAMNSGASAVMPTTPTLIFVSSPEALAAGLAEALAGLAAAADEAGLAGADEGGAAAPPQAVSSPASRRTLERRVMSGVPAEFREQAVGQAVDVLDDLLQVDDVGVLGVHVPQGEGVRGLAAVEA